MKIWKRREVNADLSDGETFDVTSEDTGERYRVHAIRAWIGDDLTLSFSGWGRRIKRDGTPVRVGVARVGLDEQDIPDSILATMLHELW